MSTKLSRRNALKMIALSPVAAGVLLSGSKLEASEELQGKIVIVGGGSGAIMVLSRLQNTLKNPDITIIAPNEIHIYQPGQVFVAAGEIDEDQLFLDNNNYIDQEKVTWIKDEVKNFDPKNNSVITKANKTIHYDYLVVATGIEYYYEEIEGLTKEDIGSNGITSVYLNNLTKGSAEGGTLTWRWFNDIKEFAKKKKPVVLHTQPSTPLKCGEAPQKMLYLSADYLKKDQLEADHIFATGLTKLFHLPKIDKALHDTQKLYNTIENKFGHHLQSIDIKNKTATFMHAYEQEVYDEDFDIYEKVSYSDEITISYDFIHITPPMAPSKALKDSNLLDSMGWLEVDKYSLQHKRYKNIFGIGDVCGGHLICICSNQCTNTSCSQEDFSR
jgi:sulfide:quinone oxidoreductase